MHHIHHTEGIILGSKNFGEAGRYYNIFTRDLGMISASAQGVRKMSSKLRYVLQDFSYIKIDLVRGRDFWRVTSASKTNMLENVLVHRETFIVISNISRLLKRLLTGESANEALFSDLVNGFAILEKWNGKIDNLRNIEAVLVLRILNHLGYFASSDTLSPFVTLPFEEELLSEVPNNRVKILSEINKALHETQL